MNLNHLFEKKGKFGAERAPNPLVGGLQATEEREERSRGGERRGEEMATIEEVTDDQAAEIEREHHQESVAVEREGTAVEAAGGEDGEDVENDEDGEQPAAETPAAEEDAGSKLNRNEKKARKHIQKLGLKPVVGVKKIAFKKSDGDHDVFAISNPSVFRAPGSDIYVCFGQALMDDHQRRQQEAIASSLGSSGGISSEKMAQLQAQLAALKPEATGATAPAASTAGGVAAAAAQAATASSAAGGTDSGAGQDGAGGNEDGGDDGDVDLTGLKEKDVELVMDQGKVSRAKAAKVLRANDGDVVNAIMELTM